MLTLRTRPYSTNQRKALDPSADFWSGQWIKIENNLASLAGPTDTGLEQVCLGNLKKMKGSLRTVYGLYEASTDQYNTGAQYVSECKLTVRNGVLDLAGDGDTVFATCVTPPVANVMVFKRIA